MVTQKAQNYRLTINTNICDSSKDLNDEIKNPQIQGCAIYSDDIKTSDNIPKNILKIYFRNITYQNFLISCVLFYVSIFLSYSINEVYPFKLLLLALIIIPVVYFEYSDLYLKKYRPPPVKCYTMFESNNYSLCRDLIIKYLNGKYGSRIYIQESISQKHTFRIRYDTNNPEEAINIILSFSYVSESFKNRYIIMFRRLSGDLVLYNIIYKDIIKYLQKNSNYTNIN